MHVTRHYQTLDAKHQHHMHKMKRELGELSRIEKARAELVRVIQGLKASISECLATPDACECGKLELQRRELLRMQKKLADTQERESALLQNSIEKHRYFEDAGVILYNYYNGFESSGGADVATSFDAGGHRLDAPPPLNCKYSTNTTLTATRPLKCESGPGKSRRRTCSSHTVKNTPNILNIISGGGGGTKLSDVTKDVFTTSTDTSTTAHADNMTSMVPTTKSMARCRGSLLREYCMLTENDSRYAAEAADTDYQLRCEFCKGESMQEIMGDCLFVCEDCNCVTKIVSDHDKPSYKEPPKEVSYYAYKRMNHFNEWLNQVQGKETTDIPPEVYDRILVEIRKLKINNIATIQHATIKGILKKLKVNKYYEHIPHILNRLNGKPVMQLPLELEERLRTMFRQIQAPFLKHSPLRKNFLSYSYVLHKFMQLLEEDKYLHAFPLLKSREKLHIQDTIWQKICTDLDWQYIKST